VLRRCYVASDLWGASDSVFFRGRMPSITLNTGRYSYDEAKRLGKPGGFGEVFEGQDQKGRALAIKRFLPHAEEDAHREISIVEGLIGHAKTHIIPIIDCGIDSVTGRRFIVMARATKNLHDHLMTNRPLPMSEALAILDEIAAGIDDLGDIVSRDLKPGNVLLHDGAWKISDFGLGRLEGAETTAHTMRGALTWPYAAPEIWQRKRPTKAADIYALGCIAFDLIEGMPAFRGPKEGDFQKQHIHDTPRAINADLRIQSMIAMCLAKSPDGRPSAERVRRALSHVRSAPAAAKPGALAIAGAELAQAEAQLQAARSSEAAIREDAERLASDAGRQFWSYMDRLKNHILAEAPSAKVVGAHQIDLGGGSLIVGTPFSKLDPSAFIETKWNVAFGGSIAVMQRNRPSYVGRAANLWYAKATGSSDYRWWEMQYMNSGFNGINNTNGYMPFAVGSLMDLPIAVDCLKNSAIGAPQLAAPPRLIDDEHFELFVERWAERLGKAAKGELRHPPYLPEQ
jgi:hypothetical protein